jgi:hypothetical protein
LILTSTRGLTVLGCSRSFGAGDAFVKRTQITRSGTAPDSRPGDHVAEHNGGYRVPGDALHDYSALREKDPALRLIAESEFLLNQSA